MSTSKRESVCAEADRIVNGPRRATYDHPLRNFRRTASIWQGVLEAKLRPGERISPMDVALCMVGVKLAREAFAHSRDNLVDMAGYVATAEAVWDTVTSGYASIPVPGDIPVVAMTTTAPLDGGFIVQAPGPNTYGLPRPPLDREGVTGFATDAAASAKHVAERLVRVNPLPESPDGR